MRTGTGPSGRSRPGAISRSPSTGGGSRPRCPVRRESFQRSRLFHSGQVCFYGLGLCPPRRPYPDVRVFRRQVPGTGSQVLGTGHRALGTGYLVPDPVRRRGPDTEPRRPSPAIGKCAHRVCILHPFSTEHSSTRCNTQVLRDDGLIRRFPKPLTRLIAVLPYCPIAVLPYCRKNCPLGFDGSRGGDYHRDPANRSGLLPPGWGRESVRRRRWRSVVSTS
jgi:hypothetical protein